MRGTVFDIQRFSVHDGPGIRTTVFLKGCPLRCLWCHNPEGLTGQIQLQYFKENCIHCGRCGGRLSEEAAVSCPSGAMKLCGYETDAESIIREVQKDRSFYGEDGGITLSGGECLLQADFAAEILTLAGEQGISTAVDTCGYVPWESFEKVLDVCDLFLYDIKMASPDLHLKYTGVRNELILENLQKLSDRNKPVWIRIPVIPDVNDTEEEMSRIAGLLSPLHNIRQITLMPYHTLGKSKYETLELTCKYHTEKHVDRKQLEYFENLMRKVNLS